MHEQGGNQVLNPERSWSQDRNECAYFKIFLTSTCDLIEC